MHCTGHKNLSGARGRNWRPSSPLTSPVNPASGALPRPLHLFRVRTRYPSCQFPYLLGCGHVCHFWPGKEHRPAGSSGSGSTTSAQAPRTSGVWSQQPLTLSPPRKRGGSCPHGVFVVCVADYFFLTISWGGLEKSWKRRHDDSCRNPNDIQQLLHDQPWTSVYDPGGRLGQGPAVGPRLGEAAEEGKFWM